MRCWSIAATSSSSSSINFMPQSPSVVVLLERTNCHYPIPEGVPLKGKAGGRYADGFSLRLLPAHFPVPSRVCHETCTYLVNQRLTASFVSEAN